MFQRGGSFGKCTRGLYAAVTFFLFRAAFIEMVFMWSGAVSRARSNEWNSTWASQSGTNTNMNRNVTLSERDIPIRRAQ